MFRLKCTTSKPLTMVYLLLNTESNLVFTGRQYSGNGQPITTKISPVRLNFRGHAIRTNYFIPENDIIHEDTANAYPIHSAYGRYIFHEIAVKIGGVTVIFKTPIPGFPTDVLFIGNESAILPVHNWLNLLSNLTILEWSNP